MKILLHPAIDAHEAKRIATEQGCLLLYSGGRLRLKQRRLRHGSNAFDVKAMRRVIGRVNRSVALAVGGDCADALDEIRAAREAFEAAIPAAMQP